MDNSFAWFMGVVFIGLFLVLGIAGYVEEPKNAARSCFKMCHEMHPDFEVYYDAKDGSCSCKAPK